MKDVDFLKDIIVEAVINDKPYQMEDGRLLDMRCLPTSIV